jgi:lambda family phage tail tape measure protein
MDLAELKFVVDTKQLEEAAKKVAELGTAVSKVNKPMQDLNKESAKTNKELSKSQEAAAKAAIAQLKLEQAQNKSTDAIGKSASVLERQNLILEYMAQGNSKGQASILATAKAAGALDDEMLQLNNTLKTQRTLIGGDPFDKSIGLMQKLQNEYKTTNEVSNLFNKNLGLTEKQMIDLAREKERLIALYSIEGKSLNGLSAEYDQLIRKSVEINQANDARTNSMKAQIKAQNDTAKANDYLASEMDRVNRLTESNGAVTNGVNNKLIKFEQALKQSGQTAAQQVVALEKYKASLMSIQKAGGDRQVDYLSRALGPQITDIFVGLTTGQSPMMVLLQQGGQLRDQFALAGVAGKDMGDMLTKATLGMVSSVKDVGIAVGSALGGAFLAAGKNVLTFVGNVTGANLALDALRKYIVSTGEASFGFIGNLNKVAAVLSMMAGVIVASAIAAFVAYGVALKQVIAEESALSKAINLTGGSLGLTTNSAMALSKELAGSKGNIGSYVTAITEIAKAGGITSDNLRTVATTIVEVSKITGISAETLAKNFSKISEKPLEGLIPFAKELGTINVSVLRHIQELERAGKYTEAAKVSTEAYAKALKDVAGVIKEDMGAIETIFSGIGSTAKSMWDAILNVGRKGTLEDQMKEAVSSLMEAQKGKSWYSRFGRTNEEEVKYYEEIVQSLGKQINAQKELGAEKAKNSADVTKLEKGLKDEEAKRKKAESDAKKAANDFAQALETANKFYQTQVGAVEDLTKSEIALNKVRESDVYKSFTAEQKKQIDAIYGSAKANEVLVQSEKDAKDALELKNKLLGKADGLGKEYYNTIDLINKYAKEGRFGADEVLQLKAALEATTPEAKRLAAAQAESAKAMAGIAADRANVAAEYGGDFKTNDEKAAIKNLSDYRKKTAQADAEYQKQLSDAGVNIGWEEWAMYQQQADAKKALAEETYNREQYLLSDGYKRNQAYATAFEDLFKGMGDALVDFALTGKTSFSEMVNSMIVGLIKLEMQMAMTNMYKSMGGSQGIISTITSAFTGTPVASAKGNVFDSGNMQAFAKGGAFTNGIVSSPTSFNMGLMGEAGPEAIMPLRRGSDGSLGVAASGGSSGGNVSVQVINNSSSQATTSETTDSKGNRKIEVLIGDMTAGEISRSGSASQKSIKSTFGIQPQLIRR